MHWKHVLNTKRDQINKWKNIFERKFTFKFLICEQSSTTRLVPKIFISTVGFSAAWKSNVAAEWITTFMLSIRIVLSDFETPRSSAPTSPAIGINFLKISFGVFWRSVSKIWIKKPNCYKKW